MSIHRFTASSRLNFSGNIAYQKKTTQSVQSSSRGSDSASADLAVDGNTAMGALDCARAESDRLPKETAWWLVELGSEHIIERVIIYSKNGAYA